MVKVRINLLNMYMFYFTHMHFSSMGLLIWTIKAPTYGFESETKVSGIHCVRGGVSQIQYFPFFPLFNKVKN